MVAEKPALLVLTSTYPRWDSDTLPNFVHELSRRLCEHYDVVVLAPHAPGSQQHELMHGVTVRRYRYLPEAWEQLAYGGGIPERLRRRPLMLLQVPCLVAALFIAALRECMRRRVDIIHAHWILPQGVVGGLISRLGRRRTLVCTAHGADLYSLNHAPLRRLKTWTLRRADAVTVVSRAMLDAARGLGAPAEFTEVAPMGVDVSKRFIPPETAARKEHMVLFVGRLVEKKGVRHLLGAFAAVRGQIGSARLVIVGDGPERNELRRLARHLGIEAGVIFAGALPQNELVGYYQSAAIAVFPFVVTAGGDQEGLGLVVVEAQACGCPVIASKLPALHDTIVDGETGMLVTPGAEDELAHAMLRLFNDPALAVRLGANGRRAAVQRFSWEQISAQYHGILERARARAQ